MIEFSTQVSVEGVSGRQITDFLLEAGDDEYRRWWPGTHLSYRTLKRFPGEVGNVVYFDEMVGERRLKMRGIVMESIPGKRLVWQLRRGVRLPAWLILELEDHSGGVNVTHTIRAGFRGAGRLLDPLLRLYLTERFHAWMDEHARSEFRRLGELLHARA